ncbi:MAG TPA: hypothetical protein VFA18_21495, partial [Gemmataceae bacterium]|nr:hypothetical protein [Gemmataceae bacterium]
MFSCRCAVRRSVGLVAIMALIAGLPAILCAQRIVRPNPVVGPLLRSGTGINTAGPQSQQGVSNGPGMSIQPAVTWWMDPGPSGMQMSGGMSGGMMGMSGGMMGMSGGMM